MENNWRLNWTAIWPSRACNKFKNTIFTKDVYKLLNKNLNFVPTQKAFDKKTFDKEINDFYDFYRFIRLKVRFKDAANHHHFTEKGIFKKPFSKYLDSSKKHHPVETFIKATNNDIDATIKKLKQPKCSNLSEKEQKPLEEVKVQKTTIVYKKVQQQQIRN